MISPALTAMKTITTSIVFLNYNRINETRVTVEKLLQCRSEVSGIEIIAVDNGSTDGTGEYLSGQGEGIRTVLLDRNYGIEGYNRGFEIARGDIIIVLDDDSHIDATTIKRVEGLFSDEQGIGVIAFKILFGSGERYNIWHIPGVDRYEDSCAFVGCGFAIRKDLFRKIGFYPGDFFLYHNEIYVAINIRLLGYRIVFDPLCVAVHRTLDHSRDPSRRIYFTLKNSLNLIWKYYPLPVAAYMSVSRIIISFSHAIYHRKPVTAAKALRDFLTSLPLKRNVLPKEQRVPLRPFFYQNSILHRIPIELKKDHAGS